eukprot:Skav208522  [mRNA]  locus=scaffold1322:228189:230772:- [translate_table: standard]
MLYRAKAAYGSTMMKTSPLQLACLMPGLMACQKGEYCGGSTPSCATLLGHFFECRLQVVAIATQQKSAAEESDWDSSYLFTKLVQILIEEEPGSSGAAAHFALAGCLDWNSPSERKCDLNETRMHLVMDSWMSNWPLEAAAIAERPGRNAEGVDGAPTELGLDDVPTLLANCDGKVMGDLWSLILGGKFDCTYVARLVPTVVTCKPSPI